jgi:hypothetical protein
MNDRQVFSLRNIVTDHEDVAGLEKYARTLTRGVRKFGTILTVDLYKKTFLWHVRVSPLNPEGKPLSIEQLSLIEKSVTLRLARELIADVGRPDSDKIHEGTHHGMHLQSLTIQEIICR